MNRQRLDAEELRDSVLAVSGTLDSTMGGPGFELFRFKDDHSPIYDHIGSRGIDNPRVRPAHGLSLHRAERAEPVPRMPRLCRSRTSIHRSVSTTITALQALALLNDVFMVRQSQYFARRLETI